MEAKKKVFVSAILAGVAITIGSVVNLMSGNRFVGAALFSIGLICVCGFRWSLFTGKVPYAKTEKDIFALPLIWFGNLAGAYIAGSIAAIARSPALLLSARELLQSKLAVHPFQVFFSAACCNVLIYIAVEGYREIKDEFGKYLTIVFAVSSFILCGFEHCVADMAYAAIAMDYSLHGIAFLLVVTAGNIFGGIMISALNSVVKEAA